jgi:hypothetical protein
MKFTVEPFVIDGKPAVNPEGQGVMKIVGEKDGYVCPAVYCLEQFVPEAKELITGHVEMLEFRRGKLH